MNEKVEQSIQPSDSYVTVAQLRAIDPTSQELGDCLAWLEASASEQVLTDLLDNNLLSVFTGWLKNDRGDAGDRERLLKLMLNLPVTQQHVLASQPVALLRRIGEEDGRPDVADAAVRCADLYASFLDAPAESVAAAEAQAAARGKRKFRLKAAAAAAAADAAGVAAADAAASTQSLSGEAVAEDDHDAHDPRPTKHARVAEQRLAGLPSSPDAAAAAAAAIAGANVDMKTDEPVASEDAVAAEAEFMRRRMNPALWEKIYGDEERLKEREYWRRFEAERRASALPASEAFASAQPAAAAAGSNNNNNNNNNNSARKVWFPSTRRRLVSTRLYEKDKGIFEDEHTALGEDDRQHLWRLHSMAAAIVWRKPQAVLLPPEVTALRQARSCDSTERVARKQAAVHEFAAIYPVDELIPNAPDESIAQQLPDQLALDDAAVPLIPLHAPEPDTHEHVQQPPPAPPAASFFSSGGGGGGGGGGNEQVELTELWPDASAWPAVPSAQAAQYGGPNGQWAPRAHSPPRGDQYYHGPPPARRPPPQHAFDRRSRWDDPGGDTRRDDRRGGDWRDDRRGGDRRHDRRGERRFDDRRDERRFDDRRDERRFDDRRPSRDDDRRPRSSSSSSRGNAERHRSRSHSPRVSAEASSRSSRDDGGVNLERSVELCNLPSQYDAKSLREDIESEGFERDVKNVTLDRGGALVEFNNEAVLQIFFDRWNNRPYPRNQSIRCRAQFARRPPPRPVASVPPRANPDFSIRGNRADDVRGTSQRGFVCKFWSTGSGCFRGDRCFFIHDRKLIPDNYHQYK